jgi:hypothetical protein
LFGRAEVRFFLSVSCSSSSSSSDGDAAFGPDEERGKHARGELCERLLIAMHSLVIWAGVLRSTVPLAIMSMLDRLKNAAKQGASKLTEAVGLGAASLTGTRA